MSSFMTIESCRFKNIMIAGPGTFFFISSNEYNNIVIKNNSFLNSKSKSYFIYIDQSYNITFLNNTFSNNLGNLINSFSSIIIFNDNYFKNQTCYFDQGCIFNIQKSCQITLQRNLIENISNVNEGGVYYIKSSMIFIENEKINNVESFVGKSCMMGINSFISYQSLIVHNFKRGCIFISNSTFLISNSNFVSSPFQLTQSNTLICYSTLCLFNCFKIQISKVNFEGNDSNTLYGGVLIFDFIKIIINFRLFTQSMHLKPKLGNSK